MLKPVCALLLMLLTAAPAVAAETAQRWNVLPEKSGLIHQATGQTGQARVQSYATEIFFDPSALDKSSFMISFSLTPPGQAEAKPGETLDGLFESSSVTRKDKGTFIAKGTLNILGTRQPVVVTISPSFVKNSDPPAMLFDGGFTFQPRAFVDDAMAGPYPSELVMQFRFMAEPLP